MDRMPVNVTHPTPGQAMGRPAGNKNKTMYINFKAGEARQFGNATVTPVDSAVIPVEMLFNENSTAGEVRPMMSAAPRLRHEDGTVRPFYFERDENLVLGHEDLSEKGLLVFADPRKDNRAWSMSAEERKTYVDFALEEGEVDEDTVDEIRQRCDMFGMEALRENEQVLLGLDADKLYDVQDYMHQTGMWSPSYRSSDYTTYGLTDTGRYMQIELKSEPGVMRNVYEAPISGSKHALWDMEPAEGKVCFMSLKDDEFEVKGVYEGRPFQAERDDAADNLATMYAQTTRQMQAQAEKALSSGPFSQLMDKVDEMDASGDAEKEDGGHGVV